MGNRPLCTPHVRTQPQELKIEYLLYLAHGTGSGKWSTAYQKAKDFVGKLSDEQKLNLTSGTSSIQNGCSGNIVPIEEFPGMCVSDAGNGLVSFLRQSKGTISDYQ